ncbi:Formate hydrogenlyase subunit 7 [Granulibacter bethesdensis CGDNIH1]|uniref:Formate hydrogenlyase subunit 7 n=2 Tax=Granulibacter bethesdensis TaxID=364410 RepID=Q0BPG7_GRABC|nr:Formate hydrogenlyase subunit 7 [Granulibacter bethesdensis CGDNIH1]APH53167.1 Formate hydrogenlyase subunit 7 [Granulibacter bethesdensis]APH65856.1 Formate hydrogenlyase subunit 7 [Granulibacter bethesdensis]
MIGWGWHWLLSRSRPPGLICEALMRWLPSLRASHPGLWDDTASLPHAETVAALIARRRSSARPKLGQALSILHVESGGGSACLLELEALRAAPGLLARHGLRFVTSPLHADILLITGDGCHNLTSAIHQAWEAMPGPRWAIAVGDGAAGDGLLRGSYASTGNMEEIPFDLVIPGSPPAADTILSGLRALVAANADPL